MGIFGRAFSPRNNTSILTADEAWRRLISMGGGKSRSGINVTPDEAMKTGAVYACVRVLAEDVAKLPLILHRRIKSGGKERATDHHLYWLLHDEPNGFQTSFECREMMQGHLGLRGNAYAFVNRVGREVREILPIHPDRVKPTLGPDWEPAYDIRMGAGPETTRFSQSEILHLHGLSSDGLVGLSPVAMAREAIGLAGAAERHGALYFGNGGKPGVIITHPPDIEDDHLVKIQGRIEESVSGDNVFRALMLDDTMKVEQLSLNHADAQFLESRKFQVPEIARFFRMPLHKIQDMSASTNNNIEHQAIEYLTDTLQPWLVRWEQRLSKTLLTKEERRQGLFFEFNADGILRGDTKTRYAANAQAISSGWKSRNEVRVQENMNPVDGLDEFLEPLNMAHATEERTDGEAA